MANASPAWLVIGANVWVNDSEESWRLAVLDSQADGQCTVTYTDDKSTATVPAKTLQPAGASSDAEQLAFSDLTHLPYLNEPSLLQCMKSRFKANEIYSMAGCVLIAINPCKHLNLYTPEITAKYVAADADGPAKAPHIFQITADAFKAMTRERRSQSIVVSGESGAGKTETTKKALQLLASLAGGTGIADRVMDTNPILEAFGNAKTLRNDNSSRFGKLLEVSFDEGNSIAGACVKTYLLEKSRVTTQLPGERSYHVFYQLVAGASEEQCKAYHLPADAADFNYLSKSGCLAIAGVNDHQNFEELCSAMEYVGITRAMQADVWSLVAAVLWLGNVEFSADSSDKVSVQDGKALQYAAELLKVDVAQLEAALLTRKLMIVGEVTIKNNSLAQAEEARDSLAKGLYAGLFNWLVEQVNAKLAPQVKTSGGSIGVLDIFGFEHFDTNGFEQLCINTTNERLQQVFNRHVIDLQKQEYEDEGVANVDIQYNNNSKTVDTIGKAGKAKGPSIFSVLEDTCAMGKGDDDAFHNSLTRDMTPAASIVKFPPRLRGQWVLQHYAGAVTYTSAGFVDRNKDTISTDLIELVSSSASGLIQAMAAQMGGGPAPAGPARGGKKASTVSSRFNRQLEDLVVGLEQTGLHFVRCLKPNKTLSANVFEPGMVLGQLRCSGVLEVIRLAQAGYPARCTMADFSRRFSIPLLGIAAQGEGESERDACTRLLKEYGIAEGEVVFGTTKLFFRAGILGRIEDVYAARWRLLEKLKRGLWRWRLRTQIAKLRRASVVFQAAWRAVLAKKEVERLRLEAAVVSMQRLYRRELYRKRQWQRLLDVVHQVVDNVRSTRSAIDTWAEEVDSAAKAKTEEVLEMSRRALADLRQKESFGVRSANTEEMAAALAMYRKHQQEQASGTAAPVGPVVAAAEGADPASAAKLQELAAQLEAAKAQLSQERQRHRAEMDELQSKQEHIVEAMVMSQTKDFASQLAKLRAAMEQQCVRVMERQGDASKSADETRGKLERQQRYNQQLQAFTETLQAYTFKLVRKFYRSPGFPEPPQDIILAMEPWQAAAADAEGVQSSSRGRLTTTEEFMKHIDSLNAASVEGVAHSDVGGKDQRETDESFFKAAWHKRANWFRKDKTKA